MNALAHWCTFVLHTPVFAPGTARRAHAPGAAASLAFTWWHWLLVGLVSAVLAACGGGGGDERAGPVAVVATVGPAGGTIDVLDFSGGTLTVEIPAGALTQPAEIRVEPLAVSTGAATRFRITPAGLAFAARVTLRYVSGSTLAPRSVLRWWVDGEAFPMPTTQQTGELRASIVRLGHVFTQPAASASRARAAAMASTRKRTLADGEASVELDVAALDCDLELGLLRLQIAASTSENDIDRVQAQYDRLVAVVEACSLREQQDLTARACAAYEGAVLTAQAVAADSYQTFHDIVTPLMLTQAGVQVTGATCQGASSFDTLIQAKLNQFIDFIAADYARPDFAVDFDSAASEVQRLFRYDAECQYMGLFPACARFGSSLIPTVLDRLRGAAFRDCRDTGSRLLLSKMYAQQIEIVRDIVRPLRADRERAAAASGSYLVYGNYDFADLEQDMAYCRSTLQVRVFEDARGVPTELEDRRVALPASTTPGTHETTLDVEVPRDGSINVSGSVATLTCPDGTPSADEIVARVNGVRLAARPANGNTFSADINPFDLVVEDVLAQAVPNGAQASEFTLQMEREGSACGGMFTDGLLLYTLRVRIATLVQPTRWEGTLTIEERAVLMVDVSASVNEPGVVGSSSTHQLSETQGSATFGIYIPFAATDGARPELVPGFTRPNYQWMQQYRYLDTFSGVLDVYGVPCSITTRNEETRDAIYTGISAQAHEFYYQRDADGRFTIFLGRVEAGADEVSRRIYTVTGSASNDSACPSGSDNSDETREQIVNARSDWRLGASLGMIELGGPGTARQLTGSRPISYTRQDGTQVTITVTWSLLAR